MERMKTLATSVAIRFEDKGIDLQLYKIHMIIRINMKIFSNPVIL